MKFKKYFILILIIFIPICPTGAVVDLVKTKNSPTIYYIDSQNTRQAFPNEITYQSWFGNDFSQVAVVSDEFIKDIPLGKNITLKSGKYLVKMPSRSEVYAVEPGGTLRHILDIQVAEDIYGKRWQDKIVDLPEVFFENYKIGQPIEYVHQIPDGVVYQLIGKEGYYYKIRGHVKKFNSFNDVLINGYEENDVISGITTFLLHGKEIKAKDFEINNLVASDNLPNYDCENKNLKAGFVFIYENKYTQDEIDKITAIKNKLPEYFNFVTDGMSEINVRDDIFLIKKKDYHIFDNNLSIRQAAYDFYDENPDLYDFLIIFDNFTVSQKEVAKFYPVTNHVKGINKPILEAEVQYGSRGKLKGVANMFNINSHNFSMEREQNYTLNNLAHELLHNWSGSLVFLNEKNEDDSSLLNEDRLHWSNYVNFISPLGGLLWKDNGNGTFSQNLSSDFKTKFSDLDLYAMGLLPIRGIGEIFYLIPEQGESGKTIKAKKIVVDPEQFEKSMGKWQCVVDYGDK